jgi:hypothetical protein
LLANTHYQESKFNENFHNARMDWAGKLKKNLCIYY